MGEYFKNIFSSREDVRVFNLDFKARLLKSGLDVLYEGEAFVQEEDIPDFKVMVKEWGVRKQLKIKKRSCNQPESAIMAAARGPARGWQLMDLEN